MAAKDSDRFMLRLPDGWRDAIKQSANENRRTMTQEILAILAPVVDKYENEKAEARS